ncbi:MAG TPA: tetratricopeptide repeat protein [Vicinamibacterales bacterium]|nr:tetratricopeptide repeat protein [Vicinamibacterales bacterium]
MVHGSGLLAFWLFMSAGLTQPPSVPSLPANQSADAEYYFLLARHLEGSGKLDEAEAAIKQAIALAPRNAEPRAELAAFYARQDKAAESVAAAEDALKIDPENREANRVLGSVLAALVEEGQAVHPGDDVSTYQPRAIKALEIARGSDGTEELSVDLALARLYLRAHRPADAVPPLHRIFLENPGFVQGALLLAQAQTATGKSEDALSTLDTVLAEDPSQVRARVLQAEIQEQQRHWKDAAESWKAAQQLMPTNGDIAARRAMALLNSGDMGAAESAARAAKTSNPNDVRVLYVLAVALESRNAFADALPVLEQAARLAPDNTAVLYQYGGALDRTGRKAEAEKVFRGLIDKNPKNADALNYLGYMLAEGGASLDEAVTFIQRALDVEPENPSFLDSLGWAYFRQGKLELADRPPTAAAEKEPKNSVIQDHLGDLRLAQRRKAEAVAAWQRALAGDGDAIDRVRIQKKISDAQR